MFERAIAPQDLQSVVKHGEPIEQYLDDVPYPTTLLLGWIGNRPLHAVVARDPETMECYVVTAYEPDSELWNDDYKSRRRS